MAHAEPPSPGQGAVSALCPFDYKEEQGEADERQRPQLEGGKSCRGQKSKQKGSDVGMTCQHERCYRLLWDEFQPRMARPPQWPAVISIPSRACCCAHPCRRLYDRGRLCLTFRSEERRLGKEGGRTCRTRWSP